MKVFHPDRYAGQRLGLYRARLERVFRRLTEARDVLVRRGAPARDYARRTAPPEEFARLEARRLRTSAAPRSAGRGSRAQNPLVARAARVQELVRRGKQAEAKGRFAQAAERPICSRSGSTRRHPEAARARRGGEDGAPAPQRARERYDRGLEAEAVGNRGGALAAFREAVEADPGNVRARRGGARAALALGDRAGARARSPSGGARRARATARAHEALGLGPGRRRARGRRRAARSSARSSSIRGSSRRGSG